MDSWHPALDYSDINKSKNLPLTSGENANAFRRNYFDQNGTNFDGRFMTFLYNLKDQEGHEIYNTILEIIDIVDIKKRNKRIKSLTEYIKQQATLNGINFLDTLIEYYKRADKGEKFNTDIELEFFNMLNLWEPNIGGYQNAIVIYKDKVLNNPKNFIMASTPMDGNDFSKLSDKKKIENPIEQESPLYPIKQKDTNMAGRTGIGIFAVALKGLSGLSMSVGNAIEQMNKSINNTGTASEETAKWVSNNIRFNGVDYMLIGNTNIDEVNNTIEIARMLLKARNGIDPTQDEIELFLLREAMKYDSYDAESQLVTASTDNAKLLLMPKINANADTCKIYAVMTAMNIPPEQQVDFMSSEIVDIIIKNSKGNIFTKKKNEAFDQLVKNALAIINGEGTDDEKSQKLLGVFPKSMNEIKKLSLSDIKSKLEELMYVIDLANEFSIVGTIFSINNGLKPTPYDMYAYEMKIKRYFKERDFNLDFKDFVMNLYLAKNGSKTAEALVDSRIDAYDSIKIGYNVLAAIKNNPHYISQLATHFIGKDLIDLNMATEKATGAMIENMQDNGLISATKKIQRDQYRNIGRYINDSIAAQFINNNTKYFTVNYPSGQQLTDESGIFTVGKDGLTKTLDDPNARKAFMVWFFNTVKPYLIKNYSNYSFVRDMQDNDIRDKMLNYNVDYVDLVFDTSNANNENLLTVFATYMSDFEALKDEDIFGNKLGDLLFMYNFILTRQTPKKGSWSRMFTSAYPVGEEYSNPLSDWFKYVGSLRSKEVENIGLFTKFGDVELNPYELFVNYQMANVTRKSGDSEDDADDYLEPQEDQTIEEDTFDVDDNRTSSSGLKLKYEKGKSGAVNVRLEGNKSISLGSPSIPSVYLPVIGKPIQKDLDNNSNPVSTNYSLGNKATNKKGLYEMVSRLKELNPDIEVNIVSDYEINNLTQNSKLNGRVNAMVVNGVIYINEEVASAGDVLHEFGHIALEQIRLSNPELFSEIVNAAIQSPDYDRIAATYSHLKNSNDIAIEVFMNTLGDAYDAGKIKSDRKEWFTRFKDSINNFLGFLKNTISKLFGNDIDLPAEILAGRKLEELINSFGNDILVNKINIHKKPEYDLADIKAKLFASNLINIKCNG